MSKIDVVLFGDRKRVFVEHTPPTTNQDADVNLIVEELGDNKVEIIIQDNKESGKTFHHRAVISIADLQKVIGVFS
jgi:hypothetical protein